MQLWYGLVIFKSNAYYDFFSGCTFHTLHKPNSKNLPNQFDDHLVSIQLNTLGAAPLVELMQKGFCEKLTYTEISTKFGPYLTNKAKFHIKDVWKDIISAMKCNLNSFKLGQTHVFFRPTYEHVVEKYHSLDTQHKKIIGEHVSGIFKFRQRQVLLNVIRFVGKSKVLNLIDEE